MADKPTFEENLSELEEIVQKLEQGDIPLEKSLEKFQRGMELSKQLQAKLENAEKTLTKVMDQNGNEEKFERDDNDED
ncbi:exodeoxyribonuclease VII small subunit [Liquorilactobacillus sucicola DSM 21376 = JCM 15457]|uniref:Exodeoxyribonuclease 7 small subunit n=1 Tax=Liquorilactobacillus sucicola DSM 21376 = JCM 15457 TaxID=1423806 RepID=A0A023CUZ5_9LACO|nr:exodeoxyribonuclease VII small subunit [Liquorilactobacillus sucicola]KRN05355.1 hypothetical protein FD15_GL001908 [Liquorilactobacillus sucicola DSM 21376 = JCM 15457]GAJ25426.1 exodeoxyribonuclease VII small subunit [Liquorilactobacillus sucicola DSM 21376 = JCM 15457]